MKASFKVLVVSAAALGLAFFVFKKSASAEEAALPDGGAAGGGLLSTILTAGKKIVSAVAKLFVPAAAVGGGVATAGIGTVTLTGTNIAYGTAAAPVTAGGGAGIMGSVVGPALLLASPFVLGPPIARLIAPRANEPAWVTFNRETERIRLEAEARAAILALPGPGQIETPANMDFLG